jgi:SAM-dependent methyltransferase
MSACLRCNALLSRLSETPDTRIYFGNLTTTEMDTKAIGEILGPRFDAVSEDGGRALKELGLPADAAILDVGTGNGYLAIYLASQGYQVLTGEPSTDKSHYAGKDWALNAKKAGVFENTRFEAFDPNKLPFESEAFDAVFFFGILHRIDENVRREVLREALRVSKESGLVVFFELRQEMPEGIRVDDLGHPLSANPSDYLRDQRARERRIEGSLMNITIYKKAAA